MLGYSLWSTTESMERKLQNLNKHGCVTLAAFLSASCDGNLQSDPRIPYEVQASMNAGQPDASYQLNVRGSSKVHIVTQGQGFCGSGGCAQIVFIEEDEKLHKVFEGLAKKIDPNLEYPGEIRLKFQMSGLACEKPDNTSPCDREMLWTSGKLVELKQ